MKFKLKPIPNKGDTRIIRKYAWLPIKIDLEIRWLEWVSIEQICCYYRANSAKNYSWQNSSFKGED